MNSHSYYKIRKPIVETPNGHPRPDWLAQVVEQSLTKGIPIIDAHHHLWDRHKFRYLVEEFSKDVNESGHNIVSSIYVQSRTMIRSNGPTDFRPVGEVEFARGVAAQTRSGIYGPAIMGSAIVGGPNLLLGSRVGAVLDAMREAGGNHFRGVRMPVASHPNPKIRSNPVPAPPHLLLSKEFREGANEVDKRNLSLDLWVYQNQLDEVFEFAKLFPNLQIILNHSGGPINIWNHTKFQTSNLVLWRNKMTKLAELPNVNVKIGGFGMPVMGLSLNKEDRPPTSKELAFRIKPIVETCIAIFGVSRCMFESNFPVDKTSFSYNVLWNAFYRVISSLKNSEKKYLFATTAAKTYKLDHIKSGYYNE